MPGRRVRQPLSSFPWQPRDNALIHLPADCEEAKEKEERNNRSSGPAWGPGVHCEWRVGVGGGSFIFIPALLSRLCPTSRSDSYKRTENIKALVSRRINVSGRRLAVPF